MNDSAYSVISFYIFYTPVPHTYTEIHSPREFSLWLSGLRT